MAVLNGVQVFIVTKVPQLNGDGSAWRQICGTLLSRKFREIIRNCDWSRSLGSELLFHAVAGL
jgi:uncharacterized pyridoxal phosphate-containing UPF0001 family protein